MDKYPNFIPTMRGLALLSIVAIIAALSNSPTT